jgi:hypothetical protein
VTARSGPGSNTTTNLRELIRMDYSGNILSRTRLDNVRDQTMVVTGDGVLYRRDGLGPPPSSPVFRFSSSTKSWEPVAKPGDRSLLFGSDQGNLVYMVLRNERVTMQWYPQP